MNVRTRLRRLEQHATREQVSVRAAAEPRQEAWLAARVAAWETILASLPAEYAAQAAADFGECHRWRGQPSALAVRVDRMATRLQYMTEGTWAVPGDPMSGRPYHGPHAVPAAVCELLTTLPADEAAAVLFSAECPACGLEWPQPGLEGLHFPERHPAWRALTLLPGQWAYVTECPHCGAPDWQPAGAVEQAEEAARAAGERMAGEGAPWPGLERSRLAAARLHEDTGC
jgi:hypothetical protein